MMENDFIKYKVQPKDSLNSIAFRMNMNELELKEFHNKHCEKMDKLWFGNLQGVKFILIPISYISKTEQERQLQKKLPSIVDIISFHSSEYIVTENIEQFNQDQLQLNYKIRLDIEEKKGQIIVKTQQTDFRKNNIVPDDKVTSFALACMEKISPISFILSEGKISALANHKSLVQKFKDKKSELKDFFIGDVANSYIDLFSDNISNEDYFLRQMQCTLVYKILFPDINWFHKKTEWKEKFAIYYNSFPLEFNFKTEYFYENPEYIETVLTGKISENCSFQELIKGSRIRDENDVNKLKANIHLYYFTNKITRQLSEIKLEINIWYKDKLFHKHKLHLKAQS
ncbi:hypothetical protein ACN9MN_14780 [Chryseobacterium sp. S-02]|uniref:hypothetical protein n=1 Tax=Chryseobacterium sp. S-02 TaxID=3404064 RepID=UPI003CF0E011